MNFDVGFCDKEMPSLHMRTNLVCDNHFECVQIDYVISILNVGFCDKEIFSIYMKANLSFDIIFKVFGLIMRDQFLLVIFAIKKVKM